MSQEFVHLHSHTEYSMLDGAVRIPALMQHLKDNNMHSIAITDHGNMFGAVDFYRQAKEAGIQPILGCEVYVAPDKRTDRKYDRSLGEESAYHMILLVQNDVGYRNLCKLVSRAYFEGFYRKPRVDMELLLQYNEGLIASSACLQGMVAKSILGRDRGQTRKIVKTLSEMFEDRFYLELQENRIPEQNVVNEANLGLAKEFDLPLLATNDNHYLCAADWEIQDMLLAIGTGKLHDDPHRMRFPEHEYWVKPPELMWEEFSYCPEALENTLRVAERCDFQFQFGENHLPNFGPDTEDINDILRVESEKGFQRRVEEGGVDKSKMKEYKERLNYELEVITDSGFPGYFMIVSDFINWAKDEKIPIGPGRGSAAGSLVSYALRITDLDPIEYGLLFGRFMNPGRKEMPDIDVDICMNGRERVIDYVTEKYGGKDHVSQIATFNRIKAKRAYKDVGKALGLPYADTDQVCKMIGNDPNMTLQKAYDSDPELKKLIDGTKESRECFDFALRLEGTVREQGIHAAGIVITDQPLTDYAPLWRGKNGETVLQYEKKAAEKLGLIKFDFLGLKNLTILQTAVDLVAKSRGETIDLEHLPLDDNDTYAMLQRGEGLGVFQLESEGMCKLLRKLKPHCIDDLIAILALYRPGPLGSGMINEYVDRKHGRAEVTYTLAGMDTILDETYGMLIYQEQIIKIAEEMAGLSLSDADDLRSAVAKKIEEKMNKALKMLLDGLIANGHDKKKSEDLCELIKKFGEYGFNKSHSAAYGIVAYRTAWMKAHYPQEYMAAVMTCQDSIEDILKFVNECQRMGIEVKAPDIRMAQADFSVAEGAIVFGLASIRNVGGAAIESMIAKRESNEGFADLFDFLRKIELRDWSRRMIEALVDAGGFDSFGYNRATLHHNLDALLDWATSYHEQQISGQFALFSDENGDIAAPDIVEVDPMRKDEMLSREVKAIGYYVSGSPLDPYRSLVAKYANSDALSIGGLADRSRFMIAGVVQKVVVKSNRSDKKFALVRCLDYTGVFELNIGPKVYAAESARLILVEGTCLFAKGTVSTANEEGSPPRLFVNEMYDMAEAEAREATELHMRIKIESLSEDRLNRLSELATQRQGDCSVVFHLVQAGDFETILEFGRNWRVLPDEAFLAKMRMLFPDAMKMEIS